MDDVMAFFDKVSTKAKEFADNAKINVRIADEKRNISDLKEKLGNAVWEKYCGSDAADAEISRLCESIRIAYGNIDSLTAELEKKPKATQNEELFCRNCGAKLSCGQAFCGKCGTKVEPPEEDKSSQCSSCGTELTSDQTFCPNCGTKNQ